VAAPAASTRLKIGRCAGTDNSPMSNLIVL
jgi:hypothetical protein